jgi:hypothetical protein
MNKLYYKISAPKNPMVEDFVIPPNKIGYYILDADVIRDEVRSFYLDKLGLDISMVILFSRPQRQQWPLRDNQGVIHSDIQWNNDQWQQLYYGVNYELTTEPSKLSWWDVKDTPIYPPHPDPVTRDDMLKGIHYGQRNNLLALTDNYCRLDSVLINDEPVLVNTAQPHSVEYAGQGMDRWAVSLRFNRSVNSWEEAVDLFKSVIQ